ncbi:MAG TPA: hypothetical protein VKF62_06990, partial [Planctomycetota bacterium]|nr:hypothetical protein [Planctomycetota bacterium]
RKARILVVDTWARWTRIPDDGANKEGPTLEALDVLDPARREGILVLVPHHPSKAEGREGGNAARGSSALPGEVDATVELRNDRHDGDPNRRRLHVESRASGVFDLLISLKRGDGQDKPDRYDEVGEVEEVRRREVAERVVAFVGSHPGSTGPEIEAGADTRGRDVQGALPRLSCDPPRRLLRTGGGKAGDPFRYWPVGTVPPSNNGSPPSPSALPPAEMLDLGNRESPSPSAPRKGAGRRRRSRAVRAKPGASVSVSANGSAITPSETPS